ncbi:Membrane protein involved in the export of O-antigen and teichoic acid [Lutibacter oricola]|uniref:Membrane protein involved in the export of O-antigen and teichoic acid n=1 Tax=Lutibacter oricola TaxID=762486 RepID=A0A1H2QTT8_9FLAO|nr:polysaccharide biosynthesis C-terminal domain-containing protein [Lutibacter oricola]SDW10607.1 Membrane protein involved in the export of O-antigen and teichoic acid [Lutibacter oricola]
MSALKRFFKDTIIYGIAAVLPRVINFMLVRVHTDALPTNNYAENTNFYIWIALLSVLLTFGMETAFFRFYKTEDKKDALISTAFISVFTTALLFVIIAFSFSGFFTSIFDFENNPLQLKLLIGIIALDTLMVVPFAYLRASNRPIKYTAIKLINVGVIVAINLLFLKYIPEFKAAQKSIPNFLNEISNNTTKVNFIFIANIIGSAICFLLLIPYLLKFKWSFNTQLFKKMVSYSWPIAVAGVAYVINENLDKILIGKIIDKDAMGIYSACYKLAIFMNLYIMAFRLGAEPFFFNHSDKKNAKETYAKILNYFIIVGALVFVGIVVFIDLLKRPFINEAYWEAIIIVPIVLLANLFLGVYHNLAIWYKLTDKTRYAMIFSIIGAVITIVVNVLLIPKIGFIASAWATLLAYGTMMILSYFIGKKYYPVPYNLKKSGSYLISSITIAYISFNYYRENYFVSLGLVFLFAFLIFWNEKKELQAIFKRK